MSIYSGKFKALVSGVFTSAEGEKDCLTIGFKITEEYVKEVGSDFGDWQAPSRDFNTKAYKKYWLVKEVSEGRDKSSYDVSREFFEKDYGLSFESFQTSEELSTALVGAEKILILEADEYESHRIKYVNNVGGGSRAKGRDLSSLLR